MEEEKLYGCSIAPRIVNKNERDDQAAFKDGFKSGAVSVNQLKEFIKNGWAFSYAYKHDLRSSSNFIGTEILAADIDGGLSLEDALKHPLVKHSASFIYTTVNHQKNSPRFRVVFALAKPILDREELSQVTTAIAARLSGDMSATDPARIFYGSKGCEIFEIGNELTAEVVNELSAQGGELFRTTNHLLKGNSASVRSARLIPNDLMVKLKNGEIVSISTLKKKTTIFCPDHNDTHPSAFVGFSEKGSCFIYCHACQTTRWVKGEESRFDFNEFEKAAKKIAADEKYETKLVRGFAFYLRKKRKVGGQIYVSEKEKLSIDELREGITFVKSPKGSGKTTMLPEIFRDKAFRITGGSLSFEELEENEDPDCEPLYRVDETDFSILLIGHRQALIRELCKRIGLNCYLDDYGEKGASGWQERRRVSQPFKIEQRQKRYGICLDSLPILRREQYDLIIVDESEQVLSHFLSDTMKEKRYQIFDLFARLLKKAKHVVCLDADLGWVTFNTVCELADADSFDECMRKADQPQSKRKKLLVSRPVYIYLNEFKEQDEEIKLYVNENQLRAEIQDDLKNEKKIFITSNSKEKITRLHQYLIGEFPAKQFLFVTSENSRDADVQAIILDIKNKISNFDAVLTSPSLSTGIDITFPDDEKIIDVVYGLFEQKITDHFEIDQQIRRVRHPKEVKVWISPQKFYFETNIAALSAADQVNTLLANTHADFDAVPLKNEWGNKSAFFRMSTSIESKRRASFNDLKENFRRYKEEQGYRVIEIEKNKDLAKLGKEIKNKSTDNERQQRVEVILTAKPIDQRKFIAIKQALKNLQVVSASDRLSYKKSSIEFIYRREANEQIIADYLDHRVRCIFVLEELLFFSATADADSASSKDMIKELKISDIRQKINQQHPEVISIQSIEVLAVLLLDILSETPLFSGGKFDSDKLFKKSDFDQFVAAVKQYKNVLSTYKIPVRSDIAHNPIRFLGELLRLVGLKTEKHSRDQSGQQTDYLYQLEKSSFNFMMEIIERRKSLPPDDYIKTYWKAVHQRQGFTTPIYVCSPNDWGFDEWEILMDEDLEEIFKNRKAGRSSDSWFKVLANE